MSNAFQSCKSRNFVLIPGNTAQILPAKENSDQPLEDQRNIRIVRSPLSLKKPANQPDQNPSGTNGTRPLPSLTKNITAPKGAPNPNAPRRIEVKPPQNPNPSQSKNPRANRNPRKITPEKSIYVFMDRNSALPSLGNKNNDKCSDIVPIAIQLSNLANKGVQFVASNPGCINIITDKNELYVSQTVVNEERNSFVEFNIPQNFSQLKILSVSCGAEHTIACAMKDNCFFVLGLGSNAYGQLGFKREIDFTNQFRQIKFPNQPRFSQAICGAFFTFLLTDTSQVWAFGHNKHGQLGLGLSNEIITTPTFCNSLNGAPIIDIACGSMHTLALSSTGTIFAAGSNSQGQLGLSSQCDQQIFRVVDTLANVFMVYITAQEHFSAAIDEFGTLYVWGGKWGFTPQILSVEIDDKENSKNEKVVDVALGLDGRIAVLTASNKLILSGYYVNEKQVTQMIDIVSHSSPFVKIFSGGEYFFALTSKSKSLPLLSFDSNTREETRNNSLSLQAPQPIELQDRLRSSKKILTLCSYHFPSILSVPLSKEILHLVFSSLSAINSSFVIQNFKEDMASISSGIDISGVTNAFSSLLDYKDLLEIVSTSFSNLLKQLLNCPPSLRRPTNMRFLLIGLLHPSTSQFKDGYEFWVYLVSMIEKMNAYSILAQWLSVIDTDILLQILNSLKDFLGMQTTKKDNLYLTEIIKSVKAIKIIWSASSRTKKLSFEHFYHEQINERINLENEYTLRTKKKELSKISIEEAKQVFCYTESAPFLLNADTKTKFIRVYSEKKQNEKFVLSFQMIQGIPCIVYQKKVFELKVNREKVLDDTFEQIFKLEHPKTELKKKLMVSFENEPAVDAGGVQREFFELIVNELVSQKLNLFVTSRDFYWFNKDATDQKSLQMYKLAGIIVGMGIYNGNLINIRFPTIAYKKLKGQTVGLKDLYEYDPELYNSLQNILTYDGDVENDMCLTFDYGGVPLIEGGLDIPVTKSNREEYVDSVAKYILGKSIEAQFNMFKEGLIQCAGKIILKLFRPEELALLVAGREDLDFYALMKATKYDNGFTAESPTVKTFWRIVFTRLTDEEKRKLIYFVTASPRAPIGGLGAIPFVIAKDGDKNHVPSSHTCFFMLVLPDEPDDEKLYKKLMIAIENSEGFAFK